MKNKFTVGLLALYLGSFGIHRFYLNDKKGIYYILLCWTLIPFIISIFEAFKYFMMDDELFDDKYNSNLSKEHFFLNIQKEVDAYYEYINQTDLYEIEHGVWNESSYFHTFQLLINKFRIIVSVPANEIKNHTPEFHKFSNELNKLNLETSSPKIDYFSYLSTHLKDEII